MLIMKLLRKKEKHLRMEKVKKGERRGRKGEVEGVAKRGLPSRS